MHALVYLPAGFPALEVADQEPGLAPGVVGRSLSDIFATGTRHVTHGRAGTRVPTHVLAVPGDLGGRRASRTEPDGSISFSETIGTPGAGEGVVVLEESWQEVRRLRTVGVVNTDLHDSILLPGGSRFLMAYEPRGSDFTDSVIQKIGPGGNVLWEWSSEGLEGESVVAQPGSGRWDYAHMNSMQLVGDEDLLVSFRHFDAVYRIATVDHGGYEAGDVIWKLGGRDSDFSFPDDPYSGPCAQHAATMLPNGHVMVFDNGSGLLAGSLGIEPAQPDGPFVDRNQSRVSEYALDAVTGEATLEWSHEPPGWYAWFMGSAARLANGNTLIGWSAEIDALATEVAPNGDLLWRLRLASPAPSPPLISNRASLMQARDGEPPVVTAAPLPGGGQDVLGQKVAADFGCTDRGGSSLRSCAGDVQARRPARHLDARAAYGAHDCHGRRRRHQDGHPQLHGRGVVPTALDRRPRARLAAGQARQHQGHGGERRQLRRHLRAAWHPRHQGLRGPLQARDPGRDGRGAARLVPDRPAAARAVAGAAHRGCAHRPDEGGRAPDVQNPRHVASDTSRFDDVRVVVRAR